MLFSRRQESDTARLVAAIAAGRFDSVDPHILLADRPWREDLYTIDGHAFLGDPGIYYFDMVEVGVHFDKVDLCPGWLEHLLAYAAQVDDGAWKPEVVAIGGGVIAGTYGESHPVIYRDHEGKRVLGLKCKRVAGPGHSSWHRFLGMPYQDRVAP